MIRVVNNLIPFKGYTAMTVWPFLFIRKGVKVTESLMRHEVTHAYQQREMFFVGLFFAILLAVVGCGWWSLLCLPVFYWWYLIEWLVKWAIYKNRNTAYKNLAYEREARENANKKTYNDSRCSFSWVKYIKE